MKDVKHPAHTPQVADEAALPPQLPVAAALAGCPYRTSPSHCHILPGIEDRPETMEGSLRLAAAAPAAAGGTRTIVALSGDPARSALLAAFVARGTRTSVTACAFTGSFGRAVRRFAFELLRQGLVHVVASDAHATTSGALQAWRACSRRRVSASTLRSWLKRCRRRSRPRPTFRRLPPRRGRAAGAAVRLFG